MPKMSHNKHRKYANRVNQQARAGFQLAVHDPVPSRRIVAWYVNRIGFLLWHGSCSL